MLFCHGRGKEEADMCEYEDECNEKINITTSDDINSGKYPVYSVGFGCCMRDDKGESRCNMNEMEHFFDMEIKRAEDCIAHSQEVACFNGVEVGTKLASELNQAHVRFCENAKRSLRATIDKTDKQISEMQSHIDCLKAELAEVQMNKQELPAEPIKVADMLIHTSGEYETSSIRRALGAPEKDTYDVYSVSDLRQIAEHLLVYCNNMEIE